MKRLTLFLLMCLSITFASAQTDTAQNDSLYSAKLKEFILVSHAFDAGKGMMLEVAKAMKTQLNLTDQQSELLMDKIENILNKHINEIFDPIYKKFFTYDELVAMIEFYQTPLGKKMAESTGPMAAEAMKRYATIIPKVQGEIREALEEVRSK